MKSFGKKPEGLRLERIQSSPRWAGDSFRNLHPILPGLRDGDALTADGVGLSLRWRSARAAGAAAVGQSACSLGQAARHRAARDLARPLDRAARDRRLSRADRPGLGAARIAVASASARSASSPCRFRCARCRRSTSSSFRTTTTTISITRRFANSRAASVPFVTSLGVGAHLEAWGVAPERITELDWWESTRCPALISP